MTHLAWHDSTGTGTSASLHVRDVNELPSKCTNSCATLISPRQRRFTNNVKTEEPAYQPAVLVVDSCSQTRKTFQLAYPALRVLGTFSTIPEFLDSGSSADAVIVDLAPRSNPAAPTSALGPTAIRCLVNLHYRVCIYTAEQRPLVLAQCLAAGATGIVQKQDPLAVNQAAFLAVAQGRTAIAEPFAGVSNLLRRRGTLPTLTTRQLQVLNARARGEGWQQLAQRLGISAKTAYDRLEAVKHKLAWHLHDVGLPTSASAADIEWCLGVGPGDVVALPERTTASVGIP